jgi:exonuclease 3'-5' domain-containing protein 1
MLSAAAAASALAADDADFAVAQEFISEPADVAPAVARVRARARGGAVAVDLEGVNLGREGELCIIQVATARRGDPIVLFDVVALGAGAFDGPGEALRALLEDAGVEKLFFDARSDANALLFLHGVRVARAVDLQLADVAARVARGKGAARVSGLGAICERSGAAALTEPERARLARTKAAALALFAPERGGSYDVWRARPLPRVLLEYCSDAALFFSLRDAFDATLLRSLGARGARAAADALAAAADARLAFAHSDAFNKSDRDLLVAADPALVAAIDALRREPR